MGIVAFPPHNRISVLTSVVSFSVAPAQCHSLHRLMGIVLGIRYRAAGDRSRVLADGLMV